MTLWVYLVLFIISTVLSYVLAPKPADMNAAPASLKDFSVPTAEEGRPIPVVFGTVVIREPNVVWYGDLYARPIKSKGGKKG